MNIDFGQLENAHNKFCENFLKEKKSFLPAPSLESGIEPINDKNKPKFSKMATFLSKNKLALYKNRLIRALNKRTQKKLTLHSNISPPFKQYNDFSKLPPILYNNLKMFVNKNRRTGYLEDISVLNCSDLELIGDQVHFEPEKQNLVEDKLSKLKNFFMFKIGKLLEFFLHICKIKFQIIHPYSGIKLLWDLMMSINIIFLLLYIPLSLSFEWSIMGEWLKCWIAIFFMFDMLLEMNTTCFKNGVEVKSRGEIMKNYLYTGLIPDVIALGSILTDINKNYDGYEFNKFFRFLFFTKVFSLIKFSKKLSNRFQLSHEKKGIKNLIILFSMIIFITHLAACGWCEIGKSTSGSWFHAKGIWNESGSVQYMSSFYWAIVTVMTVGYGDITPTNPNETLFCLLVILFGGLIFPYSINSIGNIIQDIKKNQKKFEYQQKSFLY